METVRGGGGVEDLEDRCVCVCVFDGGDRKGVGGS